MNILAIDTSGSQASVAISSNEKLVAESVFPSDRCLSARLVPEIERLLTHAGIFIGDIDLFAGAIGPGSFTGVRAGIATVQGLALATGKLCAGFSSLTLIAMNFPLTAYPVCTLLDARKSEVYAALFDCSTTIIPTTIISDCVKSPELFLDMLCTAVDGGPIVFAGEGALRYSNLISSRMEGQALFAPYPHNAGRAANGTLLALEAHRTGLLIEPSRLLPVYIRASEAEYAKMNRQPSIFTK